MTEMRQVTPEHWRISTKLRGFTLAGGNNSKVVSRLKQPLHVFHFLLHTEFSFTSVFLLHHHHLTLRFLYLVFRLLFFIAIFHAVMQSNLLMRFTYLARTATLKRFITLYVGNSACCPHCVFMGTGVVARTAVVSLSGMHRILCLTKHDV